MWKPSDCKMSQGLSALLPESWTRHSRRAIFRHFIQPQSIRLSLERSEGAYILRVHSIPYSPFPRFQPSPRRNKPIYYCGKSRRKGAIHYCQDRKEPTEGLLLKSHEPLLIRLIKCEIAAALGRHGFTQLAHLVPHPTDLLKHLI